MGDGDGGVWVMVMVACAWDWGRGRGEARWVGGTGGRRRGGWAGPVVGGAVGG